MKEHWHDSPLTIANEKRLSKIDEAYKKANKPKKKAKCEAHSIPSSAPPSEVQQIILDVLEEHGPLTVPEIFIRTTGYKKTRIGDSVPVLVKKGLVKRSRASSEELFIYSIKV